jgi:hypothetical protein
MAPEPRFFKVSHPFLHNRASDRTAEGFNRWKFLLRVRLYPTRRRATCRRCYLFILLNLGWGGTHRPDWVEITEYAGCSTSDAVASGATQRGFYLRVRRCLIRLHLTLRSLDILVFHTKMAGGFSSFSRPLSPYPPSCLYHGLSGHSTGQSKCQRRYICEWCRLWEGEEDRGGRCLHAWHKPTRSFIIEFHRNRMRGKLALCSEGHRRAA